MVLPAQADDFGTFRANLAQQLKLEGIDPTLLDKALGEGFQPSQKVLDKLKHQPEGKFSFQRYFSRLASDTRTKNGRKNLQTYKTLLTQTEERFGVPKEVIVALWGMESNFGKNTGGYKIVPALTTLAYGSHRKTFFRKELIAALKIAQEGHVDVLNMTGSWAGAMGQCQFMPTSFTNYARDGNADGKRDIWHTKADVFASAANYLKKHGWQTNRAGAQRVTLTKILPKLDLTKRGLTKVKPVSAWKKLGVSPKFGDLQDGKAKLFLPEGPSGRAWLVYENFDVIMRWNNSSYFAISVLALADKIGK